MEQEINPDLVINDILDRNRQLTLEISVLRAAYKQLQESIATASLEKTDKEEKKSGK